MNRRTFLAVLATVTLGMLSAGCQEGAPRNYQHDYQDNDYDYRKEVDESEDRYCAMVARWHADAAAGLPPKNRNGWPPYQGECK